MRKLVIVILVLGVLGGLYMLNTKQDVEVDNTTENTTSDFRPDPKNGTFVFDGDSVTLSNGKHTRDLTSSGALQEETGLTELIAYGDLNNDDKDDAAVVLTRFGGGSGFFVYVAGFVSKTGAYGGTNAVFIDDRVTPQSISVDNGVITLKYLGRNDDEPFAAEPTVNMTKQFVYRSGELIER